MADTCPKCGWAMEQLVLFVAGCTRPDCTYKEEGKDVVADLRAHLAQAKEENAKLLKAQAQVLARNAKLREILAKVVLAVQQLQPPDSLIPGDEVAVVEWIVQEAIKANAELDRLYQGLKDQVQSLKNDLALSRQANATAKADALREVRLAVARVKAKGLTENDEIFGQQEMKDRILEELRRLTAEAEKEARP